MQTLKWRKSSKSNINGGDCVEVAALPHGIGIRDSKNTEAGHLTITHGAFSAFLHRIKRNA